MKAIWAILLLCACVTAPQAAERPTAGQMYDACKAAAASAGGYGADASFCLGYMQGAQDGLSLARRITTAICMPQGVTNMQIARVYVKWADEPSGTTSY